MTLPLHVGNAWTTVPSRLPLASDDSFFDGSTCSSVVLDDHKLVVLGNPNRSKSLFGGASCGPECGVVLAVAKNGHCQQVARLPALGMPHKASYGLATSTHSVSRVDQSFSSTVVLVDHRYLYAVVCNRQSEETSVKVAQKLQLSNSRLGYIPQEELYRADLATFLELQEKGLADHVWDWLGGLFTSNHRLSEQCRQSFWQPVTEMPATGSALTSTTVLISTPLNIHNNNNCKTSNTTTNNNTSSRSTYLFSVGGYTTLSTKFYQVFAEKERVSCAVHMLQLASSLPRDKKNNVNNNTTPISSTPPPTIVDGWQRLPDMLWRRKHLQTLVVGQYLYALGGQDEQGKPLASVERLDLRLVLQSTNATEHTIAWEPVASMSTARHSFSATVILERNIIVVAGGQGDKGRYLDSVEYYHCSNNHTTRTSDSDHWVPLPPLQTPRLHSALAILHGNSKLVTVGGTAQTSNGFWGATSTRSGALDSIELLDILAPAAAAAANDDDYRHSTAMTIHDPPMVVHDHNSQQLDHLLPVSTGIQPSAPSEHEIHVLQQPCDAPTNTHNDLNDESEPDEWIVCSPPLEPPLAVAVPLPPAMMVPPPQHEHEEQLLQIAEILPPALLPPDERSNVSVTSSQNDTTCAVCLERPKQVAFFCGHQACLDCSPQLEDCHICRQPVQGRIQLYGD